MLVVDDEPAIRLLCRVNLELAGYEVREAGTLRQAREHLQGDVAVVLLDMHVGSERGETLLAELQAQQIPVAALGKPFTIEDLEATVARLAGRDR